MPDNSYRTTLAAFPVPGSCWTCILCAGVVLYYSAELLTFWRAFSIRVSQHCHHGTSSCCQNWAPVLRNAAHLSLLALWKVAPGRVFFCGKSRLFLMCVVNTQSITLAGAQFENASQSTVCLSLTKHLESCVLSYIRGFGNGCLLFPEHLKWWCVSNGWYMKTRAGELQTRCVLVSTPGNFTLLIWKALGSQQPLPITTQPISPVGLAELLGSEWSSELLCSSTPFSWTSWAGKCWFCYYSIRNI